MICQLITTAKIFGFNFAHFHSNDKIKTVIKTYSNWRKDEGLRQYFRSDRQYAACQT